jgi:hypothetical protein
MKNVLNARERIDLLNDAFIKFLHVLNHLDCAVFLLTKEAGYSPALDFPAAFEDTNRLLAFHFFFICRNVMNGNVVWSIDMIRDGSWFEFNMELPFGVTTNTAGK